MMLTAHFWLISTQGILLQLSFLTGFHQKCFLGSDAHEKGGVRNFKNQQVNWQKNYIRINFIETLENDQRFMPKG